MEALKQTKDLNLLDSEFDTLAEKLGDQLLNIKWENRETFLGWASQHHYLVKHTMKYIHLAAALCPVEDEASYKYWNHHLSEEHNHHKMLENDALAVGGSVADFPVHNEAVKLVNSIFDEMGKSGGKSLFGYALLLEGMSCFVGSKIRDKIIASHGKKAATFLSLHSVVDDGDAGHYLSGKKFLAENCNEHDKEKVISTLRKSYHSYSEIINSLP
jgi:uncharacterized ferritin-like protein (DUF455 family)